MCKSVSVEESNTDALLLDEEQTLTDSFGHLVEHIHKLLDPVWAIMIYRIKLNYTNLITQVTNIKIPDLFSHKPSTYSHFFKLYTNTFL